jgi:hypothetical protein
MANCIFSVAHADSDSPDEFGVDHSTKDRSVSEIFSPGNTVTSSSIYNAATLCSYVTYEVQFNH